MDAAKLATILNISEDQAEEIQPYVFQGIIKAGVNGDPDAIIELVKGNREAFISALSITSERHSGESEADFAARCDVDALAAQRLAMANITVAAGRALSKSLLEDIKAARYFACTQAKENKATSPKEAFGFWLEQCGVPQIEKPDERSRILFFLFDTLGELESLGYNVDDQMLESVISADQDWTVTRAVRSANEAVRKAKSAGKMDEHVAGLIADTLKGALTGTELVKEVDEYLGFDTATFAGYEVILPDGRIGYWVEGPADVLSPIVKSKLGGMVDFSGLQTPPGFQQMMKSWKQ